jgi:hypothetical protein
MMMIRLEDLFFIWREAQLPSTDTLLIVEIYATNLSLEERKLLEGLDLGSQGLLGSFVLRAGDHVCGCIC